MQKLLLFVTLLASVSCASTSAEMNYSESKLYTGDNAGNERFKEVGPIKHSSASWLWASCQAAAKKAVSELNAKVSQKGGDAVIEVRFLDRQGRWQKEATCDSNFIIGLTSVEIKGTAVKLAH